MYKIIYCIYNWYIL